MSTLKKGDLVMTEHGRVLQIDIEPWEGISHIYCIDLSNMQQVAVKPNTVFKPTREQVEAYLKEKGWNNYGTFTWKKKNYLFHIVDVSGCVIRLDTSIATDSFDTAPEQLAEAILMARLLNATKYN